MKTQNSSRSHGGFKYPHNRSSRREEALSNLRFTIYDLRFEVRASSRRLLHALESALIRPFCGRFIAATGLMLMTAAAVRADYKSTVLGDNPLAYYALNPAADGFSTCPDLTANGNN